MFPLPSVRCNSEDSLISWSNRNAVAQRSKSVPRMYGCVDTLAASTSASSQISNPLNNFGPNTHCPHSIACAVAGGIAGRGENDVLSAVNVRQHLRQNSDSNAGNNNNHGSHIPYRHHMHQHHVGSPNRYSYSGGAVGTGVGSSSGALLRLSTNRLDPFSAPTTTVGSSLLGDSMTEIVVSSKGIILSYIHMYIYTFVNMYRKMQVYWKIYMFCELPFKIFKYIICIYRAL